MNKIKQSKEFILLLLICSRPQARAILETSSPEQILALSEIALNFVDQKLKSTKSSLFKRRKKVIEKLGSRKFKERTKYSLVCKNWELVWKLVLDLKPTLKKLLL